MNSLNIPKLSPSAIEGLRALLNIIESGLAAAPPLPVAPRRTVQEVGNEFLISKARAKKSVGYLQHVRNIYAIMFKGRMLRQIHTITSEEIEKWSHDENRNARTRRNFITASRTLFSFAKSRGYVGDNPALVVELPPLENKPVEIQTPEQVATMLHTAQKSDLDVMRFLAIKYFAGLRSSEVLRLNESEIGPRYIEVTAAKCKTRRRRLVTISPTLRAWLDVGGSLPVVSWQKRLAKVRHDAGVPFPANAARHSFCSYHLAMYQNAAKTALEAGHSEAMLFAHYRELVTPEMAEQFWAITPDK